jgi:hypothetical protein
VTICEFGENLMSAMVSLCGEDRQVDENVVKFVVHQIVLHHPEGATTEEEGKISSVIDE